MGADSRERGEESAMKEALLKITQEAVRVAFQKDYAATCVLVAARWLRNHPDDLYVIHTYAEMLYKMARYEQAIFVYLDAIERFKDERWALYNQMGNLYRYRGDFASAEPWYQKAIDEDVDEAASYIFLGGVQARQGKLKEAEETHRKATQCSEGLICEAYCNLGLTLRGQSRFAEAAECFRKAIEISPKYADAVEALEDVQIATVLSTKEEV
jgi:tetratricopeptide (TPR) repeat protein